MRLIECCHFPNSDFKVIPLCDAKCNAIVIIIIINIFEKRHRQSYRGAIKLEPTKDTIIAIKGE